MDEEESSLRLTIGDGIKQSYVITLPRIKYNGGDNPVDGEGPITLSMPFQALYDSCTGTNIRIDSIPGPADAPCALTYSDTGFEESAEDAGTFAPITVTLGGGDGNKTFNGTIGEAIPGVTFADLPEGLTAKVIKESSTSATITLTAAEDTTITDGSFTVNFAASAFAFGFCHCPGYAIDGIEKTLSITAAA